MWNILRFSRLFYCLCLSFCVSKWEQKIGKLEQDMMAHKALGKTTSHNHCAWRKEPVVWTRKRMTRNPLGHEEENMTFGDKYDVLT